MSSNAKIALKLSTLKLITKRGGKINHTNLTIQLLVHKSTDEEEEVYEEKYSKTCQLEKGSFLSRGYVFEDGCRVVHMSVGHNHFGVPSQHGYIEKECDPST